MQCHDICELLSAYIDGMLDSSQAVRVEEHIESCTVCKLEYEDLMTAVSLVRELPEIAPPPEFHSRLRQKLLSLPAPADTSFKTGLLSKLVRGKRFGTLAAAAVIFLTVGVTALWYSSNNGAILDPVLRNNAAKISRNNAEIVDKENGAKQDAFRTMDGEKVAVGQQEYGASPAPKESGSDSVAPPGMGGLEKSGALAAQPAPDTTATAPGGDSQARILPDPAGAADRAAKDQSSGSKQPAGEPQLSISAVPMAEPGDTVIKEEAGGGGRSVEKEAILVMEYIITVKGLPENPEQLLAETAGRYGGVIESKPVEPGQYWSMRIPVGKVELFLNEIEQHGEVEDKRVQSSDLTADFSRTRDKLNELLAREEKLLQERGVAENAGQISGVDKELAELQEQIAALRHVLAGMQQAPNMATVKIMVQ